MAMCPKCGNQILRKKAKFCALCGTKLDEDPLDSKLKNKLTFIIAAVLIIILGGITLTGIFLYLNFTPNELSIEEFSSAPLIIGDGQSTLNIPVEVRNKLGNKMSGFEVKATTTLGSISSCTTNEEGKCNVVYTPPKSTSAPSSKIIISAGEITQTLTIKITPDFAESLSLECSDTEIAADGTSGAKITANALDHLENPVPDGTTINFGTEPVGKGSFSENSCKTINGVCDVDYISSTISGELNITASSGNSNEKLSIILQPLAPNKITLSLSNNSIIGNGQSTILVTAKLENIISYPVSNHEIYFTTDLGSITESCKTGSDGICSVTYTSAQSSGQATITATTSNLSTSTAVELLGFSSLIIDLHFAPNLGDPIVPAFALNHEYLGESMLAVEVFNEGTTTFSGQVTVSITDWSSEQTQQLIVSSGQTTYIYFNPPLNDEVYENLQTQSTQYEITVTDNEENKIFRHTVPVDLIGSNLMQWYSPYYGSGADYHNDVIVAWVTPEIDEIHQLLSDAAHYTPSNSILGYQTYSTGCGAGESQPCTQSESTSIQMEAIYNELQSRDMHYVNAPGNYFSSTQTVYTPKQSLEVGGANCIDGSLVFASAIVSAGMHAYLILVPGHAFVCVRASPTSEYISCVETTMLGSGATFDEAVDQGASEFEYYYTTGEISILDTNDILASGMKSLPS